MGEALARFLKFLLKSLLKSLKCRRRLQGYAPPKARWTRSRLARDALPGTNRCRFGCNSWLLAFWPHTKPHRAGFTVSILLCRCSCLSLY